MYIVKYKLPSETRSSRVCWLFYGGRTVSRAQRGLVLLKLLRILLPRLPFAQLFILALLSLCLIRGFFLSLRGLGNTDYSKDPDSQL